MYANMLAESGFCVDIFYFITRMRICFYFNEDTISYNMYANMLQVIAL